MSVNDVNMQDMLHNDIIDILHQVSTHAGTPQLLFDLLGAVVQE